MSIGMEMYSLDGISLPGKIENNIILGGRD